MGLMLVNGAMADDVPRLSDVRAAIVREERERCIGIALERAREFALAADKYDPHSELADDLLRKSAAAIAVAEALRSKS
ncbi:hypothetical protein [Amaricoccus macauensis]|uniref:hypothetical protein n=1 Tax=Amaricoccus macauensis TaxID=57001 RepID=UPI003C7D01A6